MSVCANLPGGEPGSLVKVVFWILLMTMMAIREICFVLDKDCSWNPGLFCKSHTCAYSWTCLHTLFGVPFGGICFIVYAWWIMMNPDLWSMNHRRFSEGLPKAVSHAHQLHWRQSGGDDLGDVPYATAHGWNPICPGLAACGLCDTHRNAAWLRCPRCPHIFVIAEFSFYLRENCRRCSLYILYPDSADEHFMLILHGPAFISRRFPHLLRFPPFVSAAVALLQRHSTDEPFGNVHLGTIWRDLGLSWLKILGTPMKTPQSHNHHGWSSAIIPIKNCQIFGRTYIQYLLDLQQVQAWWVIDCEG